MKYNILNAKHISRIAILASIAAILLFINFPIFIFPSFYKIDFSEIPCLLCGFALGPMSGCICVFLSKLLNVILEGGSETVFIGEFASLLTSLSFVLFTSLFYKKRHTKKGAIISLAIGTVITSFVSVILNYYVLLPLYESVMHVSLESIFESASKLLFKVNSKLSFVMIYTFLFNILKLSINSFIVVIIYKRISPLIKDIY